MTEDIPRYTRAEWLTLLWALIRAWARVLVSGWDTAVMIRETERVRAAMTIPPISDVYLLLEDWCHSMRIIQIPKGMEEEDFGEKVETETGLSIHAVVYLTTLDSLKREQRATAETAQGGEVSNSC